MLNSEPQTYVITSETLQIFVLLSNLLRTLLSLKKSPIEKRHFLERAKKGSKFFSAVRAPLIPLCVTASGNILTSGNLDFRVFKLQLKVVN